MYFVELMYSLPIQLRNARHLIMTVTDAITGEIYFVDDTEYLGKAYFDNDYGTWGARGSFYWDGFVYNEESELYGQYVPNGTIVSVTYETMIDYPGAELNLENQFYMIVDTESPVITDVNIATEPVELPEAGDDTDPTDPTESTDPTEPTDPTDPEEPEEPAVKKTITVNFADNGSGLAYADAWYNDSALDGYDLGYAVGDNVEELVLDITELPEDVLYIFVEALDYATNLKTYTIDVKTGEVVTLPAEYGSVELAAYMIFDGVTGTVLPIQGIITDIYKDTIYVSTISYAEKDVVKGEPMGMAVKLADTAELENIHVGDAYVFAGELANDGGFPCLLNAEITYELYINEDYETDVGDYVWYCVIYPVIRYPWYGLGDEILFSDLFEIPEKLIGTVLYFEDLEVTAVEETGEGVRTITVTDGDHLIDIVGSVAGENATEGDAVYYGFFVPVYEEGVLQLRPLQDGANEWLMFYSDNPA